MLNRTRKIFVLGSSYNRVVHSYNQQARTLDKERTHKEILQVKLDRAQRELAELRALNEGVGA